MKWIVLAVLIAGFSCQQNARHKEYRAVRATFEHGCAAGGAEDCAYLAWLHQSVRLYMRKASSDKAGPLFRQACDKGSANGCLGAKLVTKARTLWSAACKQGDVVACNELVAASVDISQRKAAVATLKKACATPTTDGRACAMLANLSHKQDRPRWLTLARTACNRKYHPACARLGSRLYRADKVAANQAEALALWDSSCKQNHATSCALQSLHLLLKKQRTQANSLVKRATTYWKKNCRQGNRPACDQHLRWLAQPKIRKRCLAGDPAACLGIMARLHPFATQRERLNFSQRP